MTDTERKVWQWLDNDITILEQVEEINYKSFSWSFGVVVASQSIAVGSKAPDSSTTPTIPVTVTSKKKFGPSILAQYIESSDEKRNAQTLIVSIFTNVSGHYEYLDMNETVCDLE